MAVTTTTPPQWSGVHRLPGLEGRIPKSRRQAIVLTTFGSLGDLYPILSVARALEAEGVEVRLALPPDDCDMARRWGLLATPVGPTEAEVLEPLGRTREDVAADVLRDLGPPLRDLALPILPRVLDDLQPLCDGAALVAGTFLALAGPMAAERAGLPYVPIALQPYLTLSAEDPPTGRGFGLMIHEPRRKAAVLWNRQVIGLVHGLFRLRHGKAFNALRVRSGLLPADETPVLQQTGDIPMTLALWSERFAPLFPDRAGQWRPTGFPRAPEGTLPTGAQAWLDAGPPPLVVTLGSIGQTIAGPRFWPEAVALARALGLRAVLLHGKAEVPKGPDVLALPYGAHAHLFPQAAAILHHGGIGTTAEALRAGKPQLVVPIGGDQFDNAARLERLGFGTTLPARRFTAARATRRLRALLDRIDYPALGALADQIQAEDGARVAALHLIRAAGISAPP